MNVYPAKHLLFLAEDYFHISHSLIGTGTVGKTFMVKHFIMTHLKISSIMGFILPKYHCITIVAYELCKVLVKICYL